MSAFHETTVVCDECGRLFKTQTGHAGHARVIAIYTAGWTHPAFGQDRCPDHPKPPRRNPVPASDDSLFSDWTS
jgi:hypothetical protein